MRVRVDDHGLEAQLDPALDLPGGMLRVLWRDRDHAGETAGIFAAGFGELVVGQHGHGDGRIPVEDLRARSDGDDLTIDAALVHVLQAPLAHILQPLDDGDRTGRLAAEIEAPQALEPGIVRSLGQNLPVRLHHLRRRERLLGCDAQIALGSAGLEIGHPSSPGEWP